MRISDWSSDVCSSDLADLLPAAAGYDRAITVFSPDGRLYQVEYAIETVRRGTLAVGIKNKDGVILAVEEKARKLQVSDITQKIFQIDDHIGVAAAGYIPDERTKVDHEIERASCRERVCKYV